MLLLVLLAVATPAHGGERAWPWSGGAAQTTPYELTASRISSAVVGATVSVECADPRGWRALGAEHGFDPAVTWAMTPLVSDAAGRARPEARSSFSPLACRLADAFRAAPTERGARICRHGTARRWAIVRGHGASRRPVRTLVRTPIFGECDDWGSKLVAVHVLGHESMHLAGVVDEAVSDCLAMQVDALVAARLGASAGFARSLASEYWRIYYPAQDARYRGTGCRDGGALDLFRDRSGWPTPSRYPSDVAPLIRTFSSNALAATSLESGAGDQGRR